MLVVLQYDCTSPSKLTPARYAAIPFYAGWFHASLLRFQSAHKKVELQLFCVSSDVTAGDRLVRVLCNATPSANGW
jgi:hypothetical protein